MSASPHFECLPLISDTYCLIDLLLIGIQWIYIFQDDCNLSYTRAVRRKLW